MFLLLLVTAAAMLAASAKMSVIIGPSPRTEKVHLGSSLTLNCSFELTDASEGVRMSVDWFFNKSQLSNYTKRYYRSSLNQTELLRGDIKDYNLLTLKNVTFSNNGLYHCKVTVDIPLLQSYFSNETQVIVSTMGQPESTTSSLKMDNPVTPTTNYKAFSGWKLWAAVGAGSVVLGLVFGIVVWTLERQRRKRGKECPIYANTRFRCEGKQSSPRPGMQTVDKNNAASHLRTKKNHDYQLSPKH